MLLDTNPRNLNALTISRYTVFKYKQSTTWYKHYCCTPCFKIGFQYNYIQSLTEEINPAIYNCIAYVLKIECVLVRACLRKKEICGHKSNTLQVARANFNDDPYVRDFGISVEQKMVNVNGRILPPPLLQYGGKVGTGEWLYWWACRVVSHTPTVWGRHWRMVVLVGMQGGLTHTSTVWGRHWRMVVLVGMQGGLTHTSTVWGRHWRMVVLVGMQGGLTHTYCMG